MGALELRDVMVLPDQGETQVPLDALVPLDCQDAMDVMGTPDSQEELELLVFQEETVVVVILALAVRLDVLELQDLPVREEIEETLVQLDAPVQQDFRVAMEELEQQDFRDAMGRMEEMDPQEQVVEPEPPVSMVSMVALEPQAGMVFQVAMVELVPLARQDVTVPTDAMVPMA